MNTPKISIIIPTYNQAHLINETLDSILTQTYLNWECIIVDDGSTDNTSLTINKYLKNDARFKYHHRPETRLKGPSSARNYGLEKAYGDFIVFLDSDDLLSVTCLEKRVAFANNNPEFNFWIFKMNIFEQRNILAKRLFNLLPTKDVKENEFYLSQFLQGKFPFVVTCPLWKKSSLVELNGFDEKIKMLEDPDIHTRAYRLGMLSKTAVDLEADCFYRYSIDADRKEKSKNYSNIAAKTNLYFLKKHWIVNNENVKHNYKRIFNLYVFTKPSYFLLSRMIGLGWKNNLLQMKHIFLALLICFYTILSLHKVRGIGYTKLRTLFNSF